MKEFIIVRENSYYDSVTLMTLSNELKKIEGISEAMVSMATDMNKDLLENIKLTNDEVKSASTNDLLIAIRGENEDVCNQALETMDAILNKGADKDEGMEEKIYGSIEEAVNNVNNLNLAVISVKGEFAAREARTALKNNMNVMLFSDNVTIEDELELKQMAHEKELLVMGPDCGTAIVNGVGLCFANQVTKGDIGLVAASGTGLQEVTVLIDRFGKGVSQALGTGGRDLSETIGGIMILDGLEMLEKDEDTKVIVIISKPPAKTVIEKIIKKVKESSKPVVLCLLNSDMQDDIQGKSKIVLATNLEDAALKAVALSKGEAVIKRDRSVFELSPMFIEEQAKKLNKDQKYIRGLYCGGTLVSETIGVMNRNSMEVYSNVSKKEKYKILDPTKPSVGNTVLDLGDDIFTVGKPHPMIEPSLRNDRLYQDGIDKETAVILLDFEIGYGSNEDPVGVTIDTIKKIKKENEKKNIEVIFIGYVLGTAKDFQGLEDQEKMLKEQGVIIAQSNLHAVEMAVSIIKARGGKNE